MGAQMGGDKEISKGREQVAAELSPAGIHLGEPLFFQQVIEKTLSQVLRILEAGPAPPHEGIHGHPVSAADFFQGPVHRALRAMPGLPHQAPFGLETRQRIFIQRQL